MTHTLIDALEASADSACMRGIKIPRRNVTPWTRGFSTDPKDITDHERDA